MSNHTTQPILDKVYWYYRIKDAREQHHAVFKCPLAKWQSVEDKHRSILAATIGPAENVLDAGCAWGRLVDLMPDDWVGWYMGVDLSPDFIEMARRLYPKRTFAVMDLRDLSGLPHHPVVFDWAVLISIRPMVVRNCGQEVWDQMEAKLRRVCRRLLYLEYDEQDEGEVVLCG